MWSVVLLAALAAGMAASGRADVQLAGNLRAGAAAEAAADGAVYLAAFRLLDPERPWAADGSLIRAGDLELCIVNESGKINPNRANPGLLQALFQALDVDERSAGRLGQAIVDWRSPGAGEEAVQAYRAAGRAYGPAGVPFGSVAELGQVLGMTPDVLARATPSLSVLTESDPDPLAAGPAVRQALRLVAGSDPVAAALPGPVRTVTVTALGAAGGGRFIRRAGLRLGAGADEAPVTVLSWEAVEGSALPPCR